MSDKRSVATDALETLGMLIPENSGRDAIHLAVEPVVAGHRLAPGQDVGFLADGSVGITEKPLGIVDPFLKQLVAPGERFWLVIYPRQITSLRHVWSHPAFPEAPDAAYVADADDHYVVDKAASEAWLRKYISTTDTSSYEDVIATARRHIETGASWSDEYLHFDGTDAHGEIDPDFWKHFEVVTGVIAPEGRRATHFSCSC